LEKCKTDTLQKYKIYLLSSLLILFFLFQVSLIYYSKSSLNVMFFRIADPGYNGNYTISLHITNVGSFIKNYERNLRSYPTHARDHPPGTALFSYSVNQFFLSFPELKQRINTIQPKREDMKVVWSQLTWNEKLGALSLGFIISLLSLLALLPIYFLGNVLGGERTGVRAALLYGVVPSVSLFIPLPDALYAIFSVVATCLFVIAVKKKSYILFFLSGLTLSIGTFFSLSILPISFMLFLFSFITYLHTRKHTFFYHMLLYTSGIILIPFLLYFFFGYNTLSVSSTIMRIIAPRSYLLWIFFNLYDFFMFVGIPISIIFVLMLKQQLKYIFKKLISKIDILFISFVTTIIIVDLSGSSRSEVSRIWLPFVPILIILVTNFLTKSLKFTKNQFIMILFIQIVQVIIFETFLVLYG